MSYLKRKVKTRNKLYFKIIFHYFCINPILGFKELNFTVNFNSHKMNPTYMNAQITTVSLFNFDSTISSTLGIVSFLKAL